MAAQHFGLKNALYLAIFVKLCTCYDEVCDRRPLGTKTAPLPADSRFVIDIVGIDNEYIPSNTYTVRLYSNDNISTFIAFTISAREDTKYNDKNPRIPISLDPGRISPSPDLYDTQSSPHCNNTVIQSNIMPKTSVEVIWRAPPKENKCVTIYAVVAVKPDVWYSYDGPLSKRVCEDRRKAEDMQPPENDNCQVCEEARYQLTFEGTWSYNTHLLMFPATKELARFSDVVGASHSGSFSVYRSNAEASEGLKMLAEQGNTTKLELEIQDELGDNVRTIIKATGPRNSTMSTSAIFRASRRHHLVSLVTSILPSPDWFLGVANLELCEAKLPNGPSQWAKTIRLNLYPMDAGTDSGLTFESPNEETSPPQPIEPAAIMNTMPKELIKQFARLHFELVRTYSTPECTTEPSVTEDASGPNESYPEPSEPTTTTSEEPIVPDPDSSPDCPMSEWDDWLPCEGPCDNGKRNGFRSRFRYHIIDGVPVGKYIEGSYSTNKEPSQECRDKFNDIHIEECSETCEEEITPQPRKW